MKVCVVIVTYGNRYHFLHEVLRNIFVENISKTIIVDNNSHPDSKHLLLSLEQENPDSINVIWHKNNEGSAKGFRIGLEKAIAEKDCDFIWLLDDDNVPQSGALSKLVDFWNRWEGLNKEHNLCLVSYRKDRPLYKKMAQINSSSLDLVIGSRNAVMGFNLFKPLKTLKYYRFLKDNDNQIKLHGDINHGKIPVAPYGGMFFHKSLLNVIGYPNDQFVLYGDDWDFSQRITERNGELIYIFDSIINDVDSPGNIGMKVDKLNLFRIYYSTRNSLHFQKKFSTYKWIFNINAIILSMILTLGNLFGIITQKNTREKMRIKLVAIKDGLKGKLGKKMILDNTNN